MYASPLSVCRAAVRDETLGYMALYYSNWMPELVGHAALKFASLKRTSGLKLSPCATGNGWESWYARSCSLMSLHSVINCHQSCSTSSSHMGFNMDLLSLGMCSNDLAEEKVGIFPSQKQLWSPPHLTFPFLEDFFSPQMLNHISLESRGVLHRRELFIYLECLLLCTGGWMKSAL